MKYPSFRKGNALLRVAGSLGFLCGCMGTPLSSGNDAKIDVNVSVEPFSSSSTPALGTPTQCEKEIHTEPAVGCDVNIRVRNNGDMTPAIRLWVHEVDAQNTLRSIDVPSAADASFHVRLSPGTYHINLVGDGTESMIFPLWVCRGDNSQTHWERDLRPGSAQVAGRILGWNAQPV